MNQQPEIDIYKNLKRNQIITYVATIVGGLAVLYSFISADQFKTETYNKALERTLNKVIVVNSKGEIQESAFTDRSKTIKIEVSDHLEKWVDRYYTYDFTTVRKKPLRGQWLITSQEFDGLQEKYKSWHKTVESKKITQKAELIIDSIKVDDTTNPISFSAPATVTVSDGYSEVLYTLYMKGNIDENVEKDYPLNPHGFWIKNYKENLVKRTGN